MQFPEKFINKGSIIDNPRKNDQKVSSGYFSHNYTQLIKTRKELSSKESSFFEMEFILQGPNIEVFEPTGNTLSIVCTSIDYDKLERFMVLHYNQHVLREKLNAILHHNGGYSKRKIIQLCSIFPHNSSGCDGQ